MNSQEPMSVRVNRPAAAAAVRGPVSRDWLFRLGIVALLAGSVTVAWRSLQRLETRQKHCREISATVARLSAQVDDLERQWSRGQEEEVGGQLRQARSQLFCDQAALENWLSSLKAQTDPLALEARATFGKTIPRNIAEEELAMIPTTISVDVRPVREKERGGWPYLRLVQLGQRLTRQDKRADLVELKVEGGTNSVTGAVLVFNLWAGAEGAL